MLLIRHKRSFDKPLAGYAIDWEHPLAQGISAIVLPGVPGTVPLKQGNFNTDVAWDAVQSKWIAINSFSNSAWVSGQYGWGINFLGSSSSLTITNESKNVLGISGFTLFIIRRKTDTTVRAVNLFGTALTNTTACDALCPFSDSKIYFDWGGQTGANRVIITGQPVTTTVDRFAFSAGGKGSAVWRNGIKIGSQTTALTRTETAGQQFNLNRGGAAGDLQEIYFAAVYKEQLDDSFISWWFAEPFAMLAPQASRVRYFIPGVSAAVVRPQIMLMT